MEEKGEGGGRKERLPSLNIKTTFFGNILYVGMYRNLAILTDYLPLQSDREMIDPKYLLSASTKALGLDFQPMKR